VEHCLGISAYKDLITDSCLTLSWFASSTTPPLKSSSFLIKELMSEFLKPGHPLATSWLLVSSNFGAQLNLQLFALLPWTSCLAKETIPLPTKVVSKSE
jgi:hypothetical protein